MTRRSNSMKRFFQATFLLVLSGGALYARPSTTVTGETKRDYYEFLFLFDKTSAPGQSEWILHPFASRYSNMERSYTFTTI
ncbi:MAG TPA: hypothetical protein PK881_01790, partial [Leptospiraceae bacterium]|nr:hypothetical protein [Leptospiraceae bacterium]